jgi:hypothetical protein
MDQALLGLVKAFLTIPSLLMNAVYAMGPVIAPALGMLFCVIFPFIALRDRKDA